MHGRTVFTRLLGIGVLSLTVGCATAPTGLVGSGTPSPGGALPGSNAFPSVAVSPPTGFIYSSYKAPLSADVEGKTLGSRTGTASTLFIRDPFITQASVSFNDASVAAAMDDGGITELTHLDYEVTQVLGIFGEFTVIAHGN